MSVRRAAIWSVAWLAIGLAAALPIALLAGASSAIGYLSVYAVERSLSLDNVFVFLLVLDSFAVPHAFRPRVVRWAIGGAVICRAAVIALGMELIGLSHIVGFALGGVLLVVAWRTARGRPSEYDAARSRALRFVRRVVPVTTDSGTDRFTDTARRPSLTPLGLVLIALVAADAVFAVDSLSAAFGITREASVIWLANLTALLGLAPLLVLVRALVRRLRYMSQTFGAVLLFIGVSLLLGGVVRLGKLESLAGIVSILAAGTLASLWAERGAAPVSPAERTRR